MEVVPLDLAASLPRPLAVTIGEYDGVHLGHRMLLSRLRERADALGVAAAVLTFDRHPATVLRPASAPLLLTDPEQKYELLAACGVDATVVMRFDDQRALEEAEDFVDIVLAKTLYARSVVVGENFRFGHARRGDVGMLRAMGVLHGFEVVAETLAVPALAADELAGSGPAVVSSTRIRRLLAEGDVAAAGELLGRPHEVRGLVVHGDGRGGADLGMPTANVAVPEHIALPAVGIYAGRCRLEDGSTRSAAVSIGHRPTFSAAKGAVSAAKGAVSAATVQAVARPLVEAHLLDFSETLYGQRLSVSFVARLREELRFERADDLVRQMWRDVQRTRSIVEG